MIPRQTYLATLLRSFMINSKENDLSVMTRQVLAKPRTLDTYIYIY